jgi:hypothetical protein
MENMESKFSLDVETLHNISQSYRDKNDRIVFSIYTVINLIWLKEHKDIIIYLEKTKDISHVIQMIKDIFQHEKIQLISIRNRILEYSFEDYKGFITFSVHSSKTLIMAEKDAPIVEIQI